MEPFRLDFTLWALRRFHHNIVDRLQDQEYRRAIFVENQVTELSVAQPSLSRGLLQVNIGAEGILNPAVKRSVSLMIDRILGLETDLSQFYQLFDEDPKIGMLIQEFKGVKPPRFQSVFEALVNAFACQQVSLNVGLLLLNRLAIAYGGSIKFEGRQVYTFPNADRLAKINVGDLRKLGFSTRKSEYIIETAKLTSNERVDLESISKMDKTEAIEFLTDLRGVGRWTAEYALLRGAGRLDVFPGDDVGGHNGLRSFLRLGGKMEYNRVNRLISKWQPYAGLLYFHLLLRRIKKDGFLG